PAEAHRASSSGSVRTTLAPDVSARLRDTAQRAGLTLNTVLQGAWALLLSRYGGGEDVVFGTTVSGRPADLPGVTTMVGLFINTLPTRARVDGRRPLLDWLRDLQAAQSEARRHDFVSLAQVQSWSEVPGGTNLFDSIVVFENYPFDEGALARHGLTMEQERDLEPTNYPLSVVVAPGDTLAVHLDYDPAAFDAATVEGLGESLRTLLTGMATDPDRRLADLPLLDPVAGRALVDRCGGRVAEAPRDTLPEAFRRQAQRTPDAPAVRHGDTCLTYRELDARSNRLARLLIAAGAGPERFVALCLPRTADLVVALLAVLKSGAAYLPVDPQYPAERVAFLFEDVRPDAVITATETAGRLPEGRFTRILLDAGPDAGVPDTPVADGERRGPLLPGHPAYVIHTSGSTGRPKGVLVSHGSVLALTDWAAAEFTGRGLAHVVASTSLNFDVSVFEIFSPLLSGGCVEVVRDLLALAERPGPWRAGLLSAVPSALDRLLAEDAVRITADTVVLAGEGLPARTVRRVRDAVPGSQVRNIYGPTEATVYATAFTCDPADPDRDPPIGRPLGGARAYVLDERMRPVPVGAPAWTARRSGRTSSTSSAGSPTTGWSSPGRTPARCTAGRPSPGWRPNWPTNSARSSATAPKAGPAATPSRLPARTAGPGGGRPARRQRSGRHGRVSAHAHPGRDGDARPRRRRTRPVRRADHLRGGRRPRPGHPGRGWRHVVDRTPVLRTSVARHGVPVPLQVVHRGAHLPVTELDWSGVPADRRDAELERLLADERARGVALDRAPLLRLALVRLGPDAVRVVWTFHHVLLDGWSVFHVLSDVMNAHAALTRGEPPRLPERRPFADYAGWLAARDTAAAEDHWRAVQV
ncbi:non-ribosomal peptide synthetase, partial [Streptomyces canarius]